MIWPYFNDRIKGGHGPREANFNTRWVASLVANAYRTRARGGVFLYPADRRRGYSKSRAACPKPRQQATR